MYRPADGTSDVVAGVQRGEQRVGARALSLGDRERRRYRRRTGVERGLAMGVVEIETVGERTVPKRRVFRTQSASVRERRRLPPGGPGPGFGAGDRFDRPLERGARSSVGVAGERYPDEVQEVSFEPRSCRLREGSSRTSTQCRARTAAVS